MRIRMRPPDKRSRSRNNLKREQEWPIVRERQRRVIRSGTGRSGSYADRPKYKSRPRKRGWGLPNKVLLWMPYTPQVFAQCALRILSRKNLLRFGHY